MNVLAQSKGLAQSSFEPDTTPDCSKQVIKGAQNSLNIYSHKRYEDIISNDVQNAKKRLYIYENGGKGYTQADKDFLSKYDKEMIANPYLMAISGEQLKIDIEQRAQELMSYAKIKYKCDLNSLEYPDLPINQGF